MLPSDTQWYLGQVPGEPIVSESSSDSHSLVSQTFSDVGNPSSWPAEFPPLTFSSLGKSLPQVLAVTPIFGTRNTRVEVVVHKVKVIAILDTGSPVNVISSKLSRKIKMAPDVNHTTTYGTAGVASARALGAYSALPLRFGKLVLTAPAIVLENESYDLLIGTQFLEEFEGIINHHGKFLSLLGYRVPLYYPTSVEKGPRKRRTCLVEFPNTIQALEYQVVRTKVKLPPAAVDGEYGMPVYSMTKMIVPPKSQVTVPSGIQLNINPGVVALVSGDPDPSPREPLACPGILDPGFQGELIILVGNLTDNPLVIDSKKPIAYVHLVAIDDFADVRGCGFLRDLGLPDEEGVYVTLPSIGDGLTGDEKVSATKLLEEYADLFSSGPHDFGLMKGTKHELTLENQSPFKAQPYRKSKVEEAQVAVELKQLLEAGLLQPSKSPWASPLLLIKKKDGGHRVVMDYRRLNSITKKDSYPLPRIDDSLRLLGGSQFFSAMDLASGYWQINLSKEDREKCALISSEGLFEPTRMPQGLCNAPATFQRAMDNLLGDLKMTCVLVYLDDITVFSRTFEEHLQHLRTVFQRIRDAGLKLKPSKCAFFKNEMEFLGHKVSREGILPLPDKVTAVRKMSPPKSLRDIQVFLGMVGYYRQFIPHFAELAEPLVYLLHKDVPFSWEDEQEASFVALCAALASSPVLIHPDFKKPFLLFTDASDVAIGAILSQCDEDGVDHPIAYYSKTLSKAERNYSVTERECLAVLLAIKHYRPFLYGTHFTIVTDHSSLRWLQQMKDPDGRLARWALKLQGYNFTILHRAGAIHQNADGLSRLPVVSYLAPEEDRIFDLIGRPDLWHLEAEAIQTKLKGMAQGTQIRDGLLYKLVGQSWLPYVRPSSRTEAVIESHLQVGHSSVKKTLEWLKGRCYWEGMTDSVQQTLESCLVCKSHTGPNPRFKHDIPSPGAPFHVVSIDLVGPLPVAVGGHKYIVLAIDHLTKWVEATSMASASAKSTASFLLRYIFSRHGSPDVLLSDNGLNFTSQVVTELSNLFGTYQTFAAPYHPATNGAVERANGTLVSILRRMASSDPLHWPMYLDGALLAYRISYHRIIKMSPFKALYGREPVIPSSVLPILSSVSPESPEAGMRLIANELFRLQASAADALRDTTSREAERANASRPDLPVFKPGDRVLFYHHRPGGRSHKLSTNWSGPYCVVHRRYQEYSIVSEATGIVINRVHGRFLRTFVPPRQELEGGIVGAPGRGDTLMGKPLAGQNVGPNGENTMGEFPKNNHPHLAYDVQDAPEIQVNKDPNVTHGQVEQDLPSELGTRADPGITGKRIRNPSNTINISHF